MIVDLNVLKDNRFQTVEILPDTSKTFLKNYKSNIESDDVYTAITSNDSINSAFMKVEAGIDALKKKNVISITDGYTPNTSTLNFEKSTEIDIKVQNLNRYINIGADFYVRLTISSYTQFINFNQLLYFFTNDNKYGNGYKITVDIGYICNTIDSNANIAAICDIYCKNETTISFYPRAIVTPITIVPTPHYYPDIYDIYALI